MLNRLKTIALLAVLSLPAAAQFSSSAKKIQGWPVCPDSPTDAQVLAFSLTRGCWAPAPSSTAPAVGTAGAVQGSDGAGGLVDTGITALAGALTADSLTVGGATPSFWRFVEGGCSGSLASPWTHGLCFDSTTHLPSYKYGSTLYALLRSAGSAGVLAQDANGVTSVVSGASTDCVKVNGTSGACGSGSGAASIVWIYGATFSPADATTYYWGTAGANYSTQGTTPLIIPRSGTIRAAYVRFLPAASGASTETSSVYVTVDHGGVSSTEISAAVANNAASITVSNTSLNIAVSAGDTVEIKWVTPTWATNPTNVRVMASLSIE